MKQHLVGIALALMLALVPSFALAQSASPPSVTPRAVANPPSAAMQLTPAERALVRGAVSRVGDSYRSSRTSNGIGSVVGGAVVGGIGMYLYLGQDDPQIRLVGVAVAFSAVPQLIAGMWNIFYNTSQEDMAAKLLSSETLLDGGGLLFVEQEARRAKRQRLVGGTTSIAQGGATLASYFLLKEFFLAGPDNILLILFAVGTTLQVVTGIVQLAGKSGAEKAYADLLLAMGRDPTAPPSSDPNSISRLKLAPALYGNDGKLAPGLGLSLGF